MRNEAGQVVATECRDISADKALVNKGKYTLELTRKCVDYDFRLVLKCGPSPLRFRMNDADSIVYVVKSWHRDR